MPNDSEYLAIYRDDLADVENSIARIKAELFTVLDIAQARGNAPPAKVKYLNLRLQYALNARFELGRKIAGLKDKSEKASKIQRRDKDFMDYYHAAEKRLEVSRQETQLARDTLAKYKVRMRRAVARQELELSTLKRVLGLEKYLEILEPVREQRNQL